MLIVSDESERLRQALEEIISKDIQQTWTATDDNRETHWERSYGQYAKIALKALGRDIPMWIRD